jgi:hypothetical protein
MWRNKNILIETRHSLHIIKRLFETIKADFNFIAWKLYDHNILLSFFANSFLLFLNFIKIVKGINKSIDRKILLDSANVKWCPQILCLSKIFFMVIFI